MTVPLPLAPGRGGAVFLRTQPTAFTLPSRGQSGTCRRPSPPRTPAGCCRCPSPRPPRPALPLVSGNPRRADSPAAPVDSAWGGPGRCQPFCSPTCVCPGPRTPCWQCRAGPEPCPHVPSRRGRSAPSCVPGGRAEQTAGVGSALLWGVAAAHASPGLLLVSTPHTCLWAP